MKNSEIVTYKRVDKPKNTNILKRFAKSGGLAAAVIGALISRGSLLGCMSPLGIAWYAANSKLDMYGIFGAICILGTFFCGTGVYKIKNIAAFAAMVLLRKYYDTPNWDKPHFSALAAAACVLICGLAVTTISGFIYYDAMINIIEAAAVWCCSMVFSKSGTVIQRRWQISSEDESISIAIMAGAAVAGLSGISFFGIKPANILSVYIILFTAYKGGIGISGAVGAALGIIAGMSGGDAPALTGVYAFIGLAAGIMNMFGRFGVCCAAVFANSLFTAYYNSSSAVFINLAEIAVSAVIFYLTPKKTMIFIEKFSMKSTNCDVSQSLALKIKSSAQTAFSNIKNMLEGTREAFDIKGRGNGEYREAVICDRIAGCVCESCNLNRYCWTKNYRGTSALFEKIIHSVQNGEEGRLPEIISGKCIKGDALIAAASKIYDICRNEETMREKTEACSHGALSQLDRICEMIDDFKPDTTDYSAFELDIIKKLHIAGVENCKACITRSKTGLLEVTVYSPKELMFDVSSIVSEAMECDYYIFSEEETEDGYLTHLEETECFAFEGAVVTMDKAGNKVSGDSGRYFAARGGKIYSIICDGMGSGEEASKESESIVNSFEKLAKSGMDMENIIQTINSGLIYGDGVERCVTVDCACINLYTGCFELIKAGGASSVVKNGDDTGLIQNTAMPLGIFGMENVRTYHGSIDDNGFIVMMTDGVPDNRGKRDSGEEFVKNVVKLSGDITAKEMADSVIMSAASGGVPKDDMLVMVLRLYKK